MERVASWQGAGLVGCVVARLGACSPEFTSACLWLDCFELSREIKILSVLLTGSLKSVRVRVPLGLSCREQM